MIFALEYFQQLKKKQKKGKTLNTLHKTVK